MASWSARADGEPDVLRLLWGANDGTWFGDRIPNDNCDYDTDDNGTRDDTNYLRIPGDRPASPACRRCGLPGCFRLRGSCRSSGRNVIALFFE